MRASVSRSCPHKPIGVEMSDLISIEMETPRRVILTFRTAAAAEQFLTALPSADVAQDERGMVLECANDPLSWPGETFSNWWNRHCWDASNMDHDSAELAWKASTVASRVASAEVDVAQNAQVFPYQKTFDAIAAATSVSGNHVAISVTKFVAAFGAPTSLTDDGHSTKFLSRGYGD